MAARDSVIEDFYFKFQQGIIDRRRFVRQLVALGVSLSVISELVPGLDVAEAAHGVPGPAWQGGKAGGTLRISYSDPIGGMTNLDSSNGGPPFAAYWSVNQLFYRGLMFFGSGQTLTPLPDMAEDFPAVSPDGLVYTYKLRKGIKFHHGRECTADDFVWTWERALIPSTGGWVAGYIGPIKGANSVVAGKTTHVSGFKALDRYTIQVTLTQPDAVLNSVLALPPFYPMPKEMVAKAGKEWRTHVIGTGPFKLQTVDTVNNQVIAVKNPQYYYPQLPYLNQIVIQMNVPDTLAFEKLTRGDLDMLGYGVPTGVYGQVVTDPKYKGMWANSPNFSTNYLAMNVSKAPFNNVKVRQAMNYAINKQRIARLQVATVNPGKTIYPPGMLGYDANLKGYEYNPARARQLLKEAGYPNGFNVEYSVITPPIDGVLKAPLIVSDLAAVGITAKIRQYTSDTFNTLAAKGNFMLYDWNYTVGVPDPSDIVGGQFTSSAAYNYVHFSDAQVDRLAAQGLAELDMTKRAAIYRKIEQRLVELAPMVFVSYLKTTTLHGKNVHNALMNGITGAQFDRMWLS